MDARDDARWRLRRGLHGAKWVYFITFFVGFVRSLGSAAAWHVPAAGGCLDLRGNIAHIYPYDDLHDTTELTLETWYKLSDLQGELSLFSWALPHDDNAIWVAVGRRQFCVMGACVTVFDALPTLDEGWHHLALVMDGGSGHLAVFADGEEIASVAVPVAGGLPYRFGNGGALVIGQDQDEVMGVFGQAFRGQVDETRAWNVTRTREQIRAHMHTALQGDAHVREGLIGYWPFDDGGHNLVHGGSDFTLGIPSEVAGAECLLGEDANALAQHTLVTPSSAPVVAAPPSDSGSAAAAGALLAERSWSQSVVVDMTEGVENDLRLLLGQNRTNTLAGAGAATLLEVLSLPANGVLRVDGATIATVPTSVDPAAASLLYVVSAGSGGADAFTLRGVAHPATDGGDAVDAAVGPTIAVRLVGNSCPVPRNVTLLVKEDRQTGFSFLTLWPGPLDAEGDTIEVVVVAVPERGLLLDVSTETGHEGAPIHTAGTVLGNFAGRAVFRPGMNAFGDSYARIGYSLRQRNGVSAGGRACEAAVGWVEIDVVAVDDVPVASPAGMGLFFDKGVDVVATMAQPLPAEAATHLGTSWSLSLWVSTGHLDRRTAVHSILGVQTAAAAAAAADAAAADAGGGGTAAAGAGSLLVGLSLDTLRVAADGDDGAATETVVDLAPGTLERSACSHLVVVHDAAAGATTFYVNSNATLRLARPDRGGVGALTLGHAAAEWLPLRGSIDEVELFAGTLSADQVAQAFAVVARTPLAGSGSSGGSNSGGGGGGESEADEEEDSFPDPLLAWRLNDVAAFGEAGAGTQEVLDDTGRGVPLLLGGPGGAFERAPVIRASVCAADEAGDVSAGDGVPANWVPGAHRFGVARVLEDGELLLQLPLIDVEGDRLAALIYDFPTRGTLYQVEAVQEEDGEGAGAGAGAGAVRRGRPFATTGGGTFATQYASSIVEFSSEFSPAAFGAAQLLGPPDALRGDRDDDDAVYDNSLTWAHTAAAKCLRHPSADPADPLFFSEFITFRLAHPVHLSEALVYEINTPGAVVRVKALDAVDGRFYTVWQGAADGSLGNGKHRTLELKLCQAPFATDTLRVELDTCTAAGWNNYDAVQVSGTTMPTSTMVTDRHNRVIYVPEPDAHGLLLDSFSYAAYDCPFRLLRRSGVYRQHITVLPVNDPPRLPDPGANGGGSFALSVAGPGVSVGLEADAVVEQTLDLGTVALDVDAPADSLRAEIQSLPSVGSLVDGATVIAASSLPYLLPGATVVFRYTAPECQSSGGGDGGGGGDEDAPYVQFRFLVVDGEGGRSNTAAVAVTSPACRPAAAQSSAADTVLLGVLVPAILLTLAGSVYLVCRYRRRMRDAEVEAMQWLIAREEVEIFEAIGKGGYGNVNRGRFRGSEVAVKRIFLRDFDNGGGGGGGGGSGSRSGGSAASALARGKVGAGSTPPRASDDGPVAPGKERSRGCGDHQVAQEIEMPMTGDFVAAYRSMRQALNEEVSPPQNSGAVAGVGAAAVGDSAVPPLRTRTSRLKLSPRDKAMLEEFWAEVKLLVILRHPCLILFMGAGVEEPELFLVTEIMKNGSLMEYMSDERVEFTWERRISYARCCASGMNYLHSNNPPILHLDLKSANLLIADNDYQLKICDFGLSRLLHDSSSATILGPRGTLLYMAPELLGTASFGSTACDVYSFGLVMVELVTRSLSYAQQCIEMGSQFRAWLIANKTVVRPAIPKATDAWWVRLLTKCIEANPTLRPSFSQIDSALTSVDFHGWKEIRYKMAPSTG